MQARPTPAAAADEVHRAIVDLGSDGARVAARSWPGGRDDLGQPGMYSWWVDGAGALELTYGLQHHVAPGLIYAGQTGATKWPSGRRGNATLASRISGNHLRGTVRSSTFRLTIAAILTKPLQLMATAPRRLDPESEHRLTDWMLNHLEVCVHPFPNRDALADLEGTVLTVLDPPLNLAGRRPTALRQALSRARRDLAALTSPHRR